MACRGLSFLAASHARAAESQALSAPAKPDRWISLNEDAYSGGGENIVIRALNYTGYYENDFQYAQYYHLYEYPKRRPEVQVRPFTRLLLGENLANSIAPILMAMAARNGPELCWLAIHRIRQFQEQGFLYPLDEWIGRDLDGDGFVSNAEATWEGWTMIPDPVKAVCTIDGHIWAVPGEAYPQARILLYRRDLFEEAGLDPNRGPDSWEEFLEYARALTDPNLKVAGARFDRGRRGFFLQPAAWMWYPWFWGAGGNLVEQIRHCPRCAEEHAWTKEETEFLCPRDGRPVIFDEHGERLETRWRACFADYEAAERSLRLTQRMVFEKFVKHPLSKKSIVLDAAQIQKGEAVDPDTGERFAFAPGDVIEGVARIWGQEENTNMVELLRNGEVAMLFSYPQQMADFNLRDDQLGVAPIPPEKPGMPAVTCGGWSYYAMASPEAAPMLEDPKARDVVFDLIAGPFRYRNEMARIIAEAGMHRYLTPAQLRDAGLTDYLESLPDWWVRNFDAAIANQRCEPFQRNASSVQHQVFTNYIFARITIDPNLDIPKVLREAQAAANNKHLNEAADPRLAAFRPYGAALVLVFFGLFAWLLVAYVRGASQRYRLDASNFGSGRVLRYKIVAPLILLAPALLSIVLWAYIPLARGSAMAFMDYKMIGESRWIGLDNFLKALLDDEFWIFVRNTIVYVGLALGMGFAAPIILALLLNEVPLGKYLFRTIFYLPHVMSGLVVMLLWKMFYAPTDPGLLNQAFTSLNRLPLPLALLVKWTVFAIAACALGLAAASLRGAREREGFTNMVVFGLAAVVWGMALTVAWRQYQHFAAAAPHAPGALWSMGKGLAVWLATPFDVTPQKWLVDPKLAMGCVIAPGVWGGMGSAALIYLAALKSVPDDLYEAAEIDGAGMRRKLWNVTLPTLKPLIVINFVGATIGAFHAMGNILVMTGGGPANATMTLGLAIWYQAFTYLNFGYATAMAWILGTLLIGFTVYQLRILREVEFRRAGEN